MRAAPDGGVDLAARSRGVLDAIVIRGLRARAFLLRQLLFGGAKSVHTARRNRRRRRLLHLMIDRDVVLRNGNASRRESFETRGISALLTKGMGVALVAGAPLVSCSSSRSPDFDQLSLSGDLA